MLICQSCAMPMDDAKDQGTNTDGTKNTDYCTYCYQNGAFTSEETLEQMIETCVPFMVEGNPSLTAEDAKKQLQALFPTLKRWKTA